VEDLSHPTFCRQCGTPLKPNSQFCPRCGKTVTTILPPYTPTAQPMQPVTSQPFWERNVGGIPSWLIFAALIIIVLVIPVIPVHRTIMVPGTTTTVSQSTSLAVSYQTYQTNTQQQIQTYKGSISWVSDQYYNYYYSYYPYYYTNCYYDQYGYYYCDYTGWYNYQSYTGQATIDPSDLVISVQTTNEANGLITLVLTHYDGTQDTYRHVVYDDLTKGGTATVTGTATMTNTLTSTIVNPVTNTIPCNACVPQDHVDYVSILGYLLGQT